MPWAVQLVAPMELERGATDPQGNAAATQGHNRQEARASFRIEPSTQAMVPGDFPGMAKLYIR